MIVVAFNYRVPDDPQGQPAGSWKKFSREQDAQRWLTSRATKTASSPAGKYIMRFSKLGDIPADSLQWPDFDHLPLSLQKAIGSFIKYKSHER